MGKQLAMYVSASPEMDAECELLGQLLANITKSTQWTIKRTPRHFEHVNPDLETLQSSQFYVILLGMDIMAPIGVEWRAAQQAELPTFAFHRSETVTSPAAAYFMRQSGVPWQTYRSPQEFIRRLERQLIQRLLDSVPDSGLLQPFGLDLADVEELTARLKALEEQGEEADHGEERRGAGRGGVILPST